MNRLVAAVKQHEMGTSVADICRKLGIAEGTLYRWNKDYSGLVADLSLYKAMLQEINDRNW